ncbi:MAG: hypothetical protein ACREK1_12070, partial [Longimicrobiales bacterium]
MQAIMPQCARRARAASLYRALIHAAALIALTVLLLLPASTSFAQTTTRGDDPNLARLASELERVAYSSGGVMGVAALH